MRFGDIIKKAWGLTWSYRMLWVLGLFAGATGGTFSGSGAPSTGRSASKAPFMDGLPGDANYYLQQARQLLPFFLVILGLLILVGIASWVISIGARGGLVWAVNEIEEGRRPKLSEAWDAGFARFWSVFGLGLLLQLPLAVLWLVWLGIIGLAFFGAGVGGASTAPVMVAPACGALAIGLPLLLVLTFIVGLVYLMGLRFVMLQRLGTFDAAREGWRAFRARIGDHIIMALLTALLNTVAGFVMAIPFVIVAIGLAIPGALSIRAGNAGAAIVLFGLMAIFIIVLACFFAAVWSTFTSAMWTIFFRRLTGRELVFSPMPPPSGTYPTPAGTAQAWGPPQAPAYPSPPVYRQPPVAPPQDPGYPAPSYPPPAPQPPVAPYPPAGPPMAPTPPAEQPPAGDASAPNG